MQTELDRGGIDPSKYVGVGSNESHSIRCKHLEKDVKLDSDKLKDDPKVE